MATTTQEPVTRPRAGDAASDGAAPGPSRPRAGDAASDGVAPDSPRPALTRQAGDDLVPVSGIIDAADSHAFVRTAGYLPGPADIYVSLAFLRQHGLRMGDLIEGSARPPRHHGGGKQREKYRVLARVETVNGMTPGQARARPEFEQLTPLYPDQRLRLESGSASATARIIDLVSPIGKGQRGLIVSPPKAGKTMVLKAIAAALAESHPAAHLMVVLVGERPEEVTDLRRSVRGEVIYSTFDQSASQHIAVAELAIERAKRLAEIGEDVVVLLDSLTRLGRAYNLAAPATSRILAGGVATSALQPPRKFLGAARNLEEGGSLTILSTTLVDTGSRMDDVLFEEFKGTGNMELRLRRDLAEKRIFPAIDVAPSGTRRDDLLMSADEHAAVAKLRRVLAGLDPQQALELLLGRTRETSSNLEFLLQVRSGTPARNGSGPARS
jgi:transcription termination factor Rho